MTDVKTPGLRWYTGYDLLQPAYGPAFIPDPVLDLGDEGDGPQRSCTDIPDEECDGYQTCRDCPAADRDEEFSEEEDDEDEDDDEDCDCDECDDECVAFHAAAEQNVIGFPLDTKAGERAVVNATTGGVKTQKLARFDLIPAGPLRQLAEHYGRGSQKYADRNWEKGLDYSLPYAAALRHLVAFWNGEDNDPQTGTPHVICAAWHCFALAEFATTFTRGDDRPATVRRRESAQRLWDSIFASSK